MKDTSNSHVPEQNRHVRKEWKETKKLEMDGAWSLRLWLRWKECALLALQL